MKYFFILLLFISCSGLAQDTAKIHKLINAELQFERSGDYDNAIKVCKQILDLDHNNYPSLNSIAGLYGTMGKFQDEITWAQKAISINPQLVAGYINLGNGYMGLGNVDKAEESFMKAEQLDSTSPLPPYSLGVIEESKGNFNSAVTYYKQSVSRDSTFEDGYFNLAAAYANLKDYKNANINILKVLQLDPGAKDAQEMHERIIEELLKH